MGQLGCEWEGFCSFKYIAKRGRGEKGYILIIKCGAHNGHELADDTFQFPGHLKSSAEYVEAIYQAKKHRQQVLPYSDSRRLLEAERDDSGGTIGGLIGVTAIWRLQGCSWRSR
jgi:hypothetical protein